MHLLNLEYKGNVQLLLGEFQFSYLVFLIGQRLDAFEQWKKFIDLMCNCEEAMKEVPTLFIEFVQVMRAQLETLPEDLFMDSLSSKNFLTLAFNSLIELADDYCTTIGSSSSNSSKSIVRIANDFSAEIESLKKLLKVKFKWHMASNKSSSSNQQQKQNQYIPPYGYDEDDEYASVVVELSEEELRQQLEEEQS